MNEKREQPLHVRAPSLNEMERKRGVDRLNFENQLLASRLKKISSVIDNSKLEKDFKRHLKAESNLRRRQMKPLSLPKDLHPHSSLRQREGGGGLDASIGGAGSGLFDAELYASQRGQYLDGQGLNQLDGQIRSVTDFRKQVIATKKMNALQHTSSSPVGQQQHQQHQQLQSSGDSSHAQFNRNEPLYQISHSAV
jgi:hypothetical protein